MHRNYRARWPPPWTRTAANGRLKSAHRPRRTARLRPPPCVTRLVRPAPTAEHELNPLPGLGPLDSLIRTIPSAADASVASEWLRSHPDRGFGLHTPRPEFDSLEAGGGRDRPCHRRFGVASLLLLRLRQQVVARLGCRSVERQPHARLLPRSGRSRRQFGKTHTPQVKHAALSARTHRRGDAAIAAAHCPGVARSRVSTGPLTET